MRSIYHGLKAVVQYRRKDDGVVWNNMAAFDSLSIAEKYATDCSRSNDLWEYRALEVPDAIAYSEEDQP